MPQKNRFDAKAAEVFALQKPILDDFGNSKRIWRSKFQKSTGESQVPHQHSNLQLTSKKMDEKAATKTERLFPGDLKQNKYIYICIMYLYIYIYQQLLTPPWLVCFF